MYRDLADRHVLITGSYGQLGRAIAEAFSRQGAKLYLQGRTWTDSRREWAQSLPLPPVCLIAADLSKTDDIEQMFGTIAAHTECLDVLINNAGVQDLAPLDDLSETAWDRMLSVNLTAPHICTSLMTRGVRACGQERRRSIINILSIESENPAVNHSHYGASKGGLLQYTRAAALELGPLNIRVNGISPGLIYREGIEEAWPDGVARYMHSAPLGQLIMPEDIAQAALFLASDASARITGINLRIDAGIGAATGY